MRVSKLIVAAIAAVPIVVVAAESDGSIEARMRALEERQTQLEKQLVERDAVIQELKAQLKGPTAGAGAATAVAVQAPPAATPVAAPVPAPTVTGSVPDEGDTWGRYEGGRGIVLARSDSAEVDFSVFTYARYLNQTALEDTYTDAFGRTRTLDLRNDVQFQKVTLNGHGASCPTPSGTASCWATA